MNIYLKELFDKYAKKYYYQKEYLEALKQFLLTIDDGLEENFDLSIIEDLITPNNIIKFKVPWVNDKGENKVNMGYRIQHNNLLGVYKGGLRFVKDLDESVLKFLALEQTLKNSLTNLPLGGAKGGADFDPEDKSLAERKRFAESFMIELHKYIGPDFDVPASDLGVSNEEINYMYKMYKRITNRSNGVLTSKLESSGGSPLRFQATGYGVAFMTEKALKTYFNDTLLNKKVIISGAGQVGINAAYKISELGGIIIAISNLNGVIYDEKGINLTLVDYLNKNKISLKKYLNEYPSAIYYPDPKDIWSIKAELAIPCATQYELDEEDAQTLINNGLKLVVEGANKPSTNAAINLFIKNKILLVPSKAANTGGVIVSTFEMTQNATFTKWSKMEVEEKLKNIIYNIFNNIYLKSQALNDPFNLEKAANIVAFDNLYQASK